MTVSALDNRIVYEGSGSTGPFAFPFKILDSSHLSVKRWVGEEDTALALTTDYTVAGVGVNSGGSVTLVEALEEGEKLSILLNVPATQLTAYGANDSFPASSHERALDKITTKLAEHDERLRRTVYAHELDAEAFRAPSLAVRQEGGYLGFEAETGAPVVVDLTAQIDAATALAEAAADQAVAAANAVASAESVAALEDMPFVSGVTYQTRGYYGAGTGGGAYYEPGDWTPGALGVIQNTDGQLLRLSRAGLLSPSQMGAKGDHDPDGVQGQDHFNLLNDFIDFIALASDETGDPRRGKMKVDPGYYYVSGKIEMEQFDIVVEGDGPISTRLYFGHTDDYALHMERTRSRVLNIGLYSTPDRKNYVPDSGLTDDEKFLDRVVRSQLFTRGPDGSAEVAHALVENVIFDGAPGLGWLSCAAGSAFDRIEAKECRLGGFHFGTGRILLPPGLITDSADPNFDALDPDYIKWLALDFVGWVDGRNYRSKDAGGYAISVGHPTDVNGKLMYRMELHNGDLGKNVDADVDLDLSPDTTLFKDHTGTPIEAQSFFHGNGLILENHGFGDGAEGNTQVGIVVAGASMDIRNNRFPGVDLCVKVEEFRVYKDVEGVSTLSTAIPTRGVTIRNMHVVENTVDYAVDVATHVSDSAVGIDQMRTGNITALFTPTSPVSWYRFGKNMTFGGRFDVAGNASVGGDFDVTGALDVTGGATIGDDTAVTGKMAVSESMKASGYAAPFDVAIPDDRAAKVTFSTAAPRGMLKLVGATSAAPCIGVAFRAGVTNGYNLRAFRSNTTIDVTTFDTASNGETGVDGNVWVSAHTDGCVYVENRSGGSVTYSFHFEGASENHWITGVELVPDPTP